MRLRVVATVAVFLGLLAPVAAQLPARDTPGQVVRGGPASPSGRIAGRVLAADNGRPVRRARVLLTAPELPGGRGALTDADGAFDFADLPAGRYSLAVQKNGFVPLSYGQRRPLQPGTPLQLADGQALRGIEFRLPRGSAISGQIVDEAGDPLAGVVVRVLAYRYAQGSRQLVPVGTGTTDDRGEYRVWGLNPGEYYVSATARNYSVIGGPPPAASGRPAGRGGVGRPAGPPGATAPMPPGDTAADDAEGTGYAPTYYPGVDAIGQAQPIALALAAEVRDVSFGVLLVRTSRISGRVVAEDGTLVSTGLVLLSPEGQGGGRAGAGANFSGRIQRDGAFEIRNVPPGRYLLRARGDGRNAPRFATLPLTVTEGDISGVSVTLQPGATLAGTVIFQPSTTTPGDPTQVRISAPPVDGPSLGQSPAVRPGREGRFSLEGVPAGTRRLTAEPPRGWTVRSILVDGRDVTDTTIDVRSGERVANVTVAFTDRLSEISGVVRDGRGAPVTDLTVLAFADDPSLWFGGSRFIATARPDQNGRYQIRGLPPGGYLLVAVDPTEDNQWFEPSYLEQQRGRALHLSLAEGGSKTQDLATSGL